MPVDRCGDALLCANAQCRQTHHNKKIAARQARAHQRAAQPAGHEGPRGADGLPLPHHRPHLPAPARRRPRRRAGPVRLFVEARSAICGRADSGGGGAKHAHPHTHHTTHNQKNQTTNSQGSLFFIAVQSMFGSCLGTLTVFGAEKAVFSREYGSRMYSLPAYFSSRWCVWGRCSFCCCFFCVFCFGSPRRHKCHMHTLIIITRTPSTTTTNTKKNKKADAAADRDPQPARHGGHHVLDDRLPRRRRRVLDVRRHLGGDGRRRRRAGHAHRVRLWQPGGALSVCSVCLCLVLSALLVWFVCARRHPTHARVDAPQHTTHAQVAISVTPLIMLPLMLFSGFFLNSDRCGRRVLFLLSRQLTRANHPATIK